VAKAMETVSAQDASKLSIRRRKCESPLLRASHQSLAERWASAKRAHNWAEHGLMPQQVKSFKVSNDPISSK